MVFTYWTPYTAKYLWSDIQEFRNHDNLEESSPKRGNFAFCQEKASSLKQTDLRKIFKEASESVCSNCCGIYWLLVFYSNSCFNCGDSRQHRKWPWTSRWIYKNKILPWLVVHLKCRSSNKFVPVRTVSVYIQSDNAEYLIIQFLSDPLQVILMEFCCSCKYILCDPANTPKTVVSCCSSLFP